MDTARWPGSRCSNCTTGRRSPRCGTRAPSGQMPTASRRGQQPGVGQVGERVVHTVWPRRELGDHRVRRMVDHQHLAVDAESAVDAGNAVVHPPEVVVAGVGSRPPSLKRQHERVDQLLVVRRRALHPAVRHDLPSAECASLQAHHPEAGQILQGRADATLDDRKVRCVDDDVGVVGCDAATRCAARTGRQMSRRWPRTSPTPARRAGSIGIETVHHARAAFGSVADPLVGVGRNVGHVYGWCSRRPARSVGRRCRDCRSRPRRTSCRRACRAGVAACSLPTRCRAGWWM